MGGVGLIAPSVDYEQVLFVLKDSQTNAKITCHVEIWHVRDEPLH